jgi:NAD(P)-dependent dehydrogenase (short-subunit alcohol dehydrogenase family)
VSQASGAVRGLKALVTGASRGIGRAVAQALLDGGAKVALAVRDEADVAPLLAAAPAALALGVDLRREDQTASLVDRASAALGGLDVLVNCAGIVRYNALGAVSRTELMEQLEVNFVAPFTLSQRAACQMRGTGGGVIVNVASTLGLRPAPQTAAYSASKAALISLTRSLALEFARDGVRVNAVAPGVIDTDMVHVLRPAPGMSANAGSGDAAAQLEAQLSHLRELHPLGRLGTPDEVAQAVLFLISATFVTGTVLVADGGLSLGGA